MALSFVDPALAMRNLFAGSFWSSCSLIRVCKSGALRIILRSCIELTYAWLLKVLICVWGTPDRLPAETRAPPVGIEVKRIIKRWEAALAGLSKEFACSQSCAPVFMFVERMEGITWACPIPLSTATPGTIVFVNVSGHSVDIDCFTQKAVYKRRLSLLPRQLSPLPFRLARCPLCSQQYPRSLSLSKERSE